MKITKAALVQLARIFVSCKPLMGEILTHNQRYLIQKAKEGSDVEFLDFKEGLPMVDPTYDYIRDFALSIGKDEIDEKVVWKFFGGEPHFAKILDQFRQLGLKKDFSMRMLVAHMVIPVEITASEEGRFSGTYRNSGLEVNLANLVTSIKGGIEVGSMVLTHYASIVSGNPDKETVDWLLEAQREKREFVEACEYTKQIDFNDFWDLCRWTEETIRDRKL